MAVMGRSTVVELSSTLGVRLKNRRPTRSHCALSYSSHTRRNKSRCHVTPASPAPYTVIVTDHRKGNGDCPHQFHSLLASYMVMVDRPLGKRLLKCPVSQSCSVYSLNQPGCRASLVADTRRVGVRIQVITQRKPRNQVCG